MQLHDYKNRKAKRYYQLAFVAGGGLLCCIFFTDSTLPVRLLCLLVGLFLLWFVNHDDY